MEQKYGWVCIGSGGSMSKQVEYISVEFGVEHRATIEEARALEVLAIERLAEMLMLMNALDLTYVVSLSLLIEQNWLFLFMLRMAGHFADGGLTRSSQIRGKISYDAVIPSKDFISPIRRTLLRS